MTYTTFNQLALCGSSTLEQRVQALIGNPASYGYDTPIYLKDIAAGGYLAAACTALPYAVGDTTLLSQTIAFNMLNSMQYAWSSVFPGDTIFNRTLSLIQARMGGQILPAGQIDNLVTTLRGMVSPIPVVGDIASFPVYVRFQGAMTLDYLANVIGITVPGIPGPTPPVTNSFMEITQYNWLHPMIDTSQAPIQSNKQPFFTPTITEGLAEDLYVSQEFNYNTAQQPYFYKLQTKNTFASTVNTKNYAATTVLPLMDAIENLAQCVQAGVGISVYSFYVGLREAKDNFICMSQHNLQQTKIPADQAGGGFLPLQLDPDPTLAGIGTQMQSAFQNTRAELLRSFDYILRFDTNGNNRIDAGERIAMENDVRTQATLSKIDSGTTILGALDSQYLSFTSSITDDMGAIFIAGVS